VILALRALGVGDLAAGVPALRGLRAAFPHEPLALAAPAWLNPLIDLIGGIDRVIPVDGLTGPLPPLPPVGVAVNLHGCGPESTALLRTADPAKLWAFGEGPHWADEEHEVHRWCRLLAWYGVAADPGDLDLAVPAVPVEAGLTIVHPGAKAPSRRWPPDRFAAVARSLAAQGHRVVITGSDAERDIAAHVASAAGLPADAVLAGRTGLTTLAALVAHARLLISGDTGIAHLATAYRTPSVVLFGPMPPRRWGPPADRPQHRAIWHGTAAERGDLMTPGVHPALEKVAVDEVLAAAGSAVKATRSET
jgi:ADP-heptose:LPS heptosyltransferase